MGGGITVLLLISSERECEEFHYSLITIVFKSIFYFKIYIFLIF